jgi:inner membrane protein
MPLPFSHGLLGASIVAAIHPKPFKKYYLPILLGGFLANAADFDFALVFLFDSTELHRGFTHSILFAVLFCVLCLISLGREKYREALAYGLAFSSHFILDFITTKVGGGLELLFPFSTDRFVLGWFGLLEVPSNLTFSGIFQAICLELLIFTPIFLIVYFLKNKYIVQ